MKISDFVKSIVLINLLFQFASLHCFQKIISLVALTVLGNTTLLYSYLTFSFSTNSSAKFVPDLYLSGHLTFWLQHQDSDFRSGKLQHCTLLPSLPTIITVFIWMNPHEHPYQKTFLPASGTSNDRSVNAFLVLYTFPFLVP